MASLWTLVLVVGVCVSRAVEAKEYYDWNYRGENPYYKYSGKDDYQYEDENKWRVGRSTYFDTFHHGSCGYGTQYVGKGTGTDIAAIADMHFDYYNSCGRCFEVKCRPAVMYDKRGNKLDRMDACHDPNKIITVTITDTCPCYDPSTYLNQVNNERWCCGDREHLDLSNPAFAKLADHKWGVISTYYRPVDCPHDDMEIRHHFEDHKKLG